VLGAGYILNHLSSNILSYQIALRQIALIDHSFRLNDDIPHQRKNIDERINHIKFQMKEVDALYGVLYPNLNIGNTTKSYYYINKLALINRSDVSKLAKVSLSFSHELLMVKHKLLLSDLPYHVFYLNERIKDLSWVIYWQKKIDELKQPKEKENRYSEFINNRNLFWNRFILYDNNSKIKKINVLFVNDIANDTHDQLRINSLNDLFLNMSKNINQYLEEQISIVGYKIWMIRLVVLLLFFYFIYLNITTKNHILYRLNNLLIKIKKSKNNSSQIIMMKSNEFDSFYQEIMVIMNHFRTNERRLILDRKNAISTNTAKNAFLNDVYHECRSSTNELIDLMDKLTISDFDMLQKDVVKEMRKTSNSLSFFIKDILDISKIESGHLNLSSEKVDIRELVYSATNLMTAKALNQLDELHIWIDNSVPTWVYIDEFRIKQVLINLQSNAANFTKNGYINTTLTYDDSTQSLVCVVTDTGVGIRNDKINSILNSPDVKTTRVESVSNTIDFGLALCKQIIDSMDGSLHVESIVDIGSRFTFTINIPLFETYVYEEMNINLILVSNDSSYIEQIENECRLYKVNFQLFDNIQNLIKDKRIINNGCIFYCSDVNKNTMSELQALRISMPNTRIVTLQHHLFARQDISNISDGNLILPFLGHDFLTMLKTQINVHEVNHISSNMTVVPLRTQVLVVEDNLMNQKIAEFFLDKMGFGYTVVNNGQEALDHVVQGTSFSAILMDCMMPVMDGLLATRKIREWERENDGEQTPIIALTASVLEEDVAKCFEAGMNAYLPKPYKSEQLYELFKKFNII